jgi:type I restriction enzyme R subunit
MKKSTTIYEGISQSLRNQRHDEIPLLFTYSQLLLSINGTDGRYGSCGTPSKFWAVWREEDISDTEMHVQKINPRRRACSDGPGQIADQFIES